MTLPVRALLVVLALLAAVPLLLFLPAAPPAGPQPVQRPPHPPPAHSASFSRRPPPTGAPPVLFDKVLAERADPRTGALVVTFTNSGFLDLTLNWAAYVRALGIDNYLVVCFDEPVYAELRGRGIAAYWNASAEPLPVESQRYGSPDYIKLVNWKPLMTLAVLERGYHVLVSDVDTVWQRNPFDVLLMTCDLEIEVDTVNITRVPDDYKNGCFPYREGVYLSTGVYYMRSTPASMEFIRQLIHYQATPAPGKLIDQPAFNHVLGNQTGLTIRALDPLLFPSGHHYFLQKLPQRHHVEPIIVHNNVLVNGNDAKKHRFREYYLWNQDPIEYYVNDERYITYLHHAMSCATVLDELRNALAVANITNRILILPSFDCKAVCRCSPRCNARIQQVLQPPCYISDFFQLDYLAKNFRYREHSFLAHPKVQPPLLPTAANYTIERPADRVPARAPGDEAFAHIGPVDMRGATEEQIRDWFGHIDARLLLFSSLERRFAGFSDPALNYFFDQRVRESLPFLACHKQQAC